MAPICSACSPVAGRSEQLTREPASGNGRCRGRRCGPGPGWPGSKTSGPVLLSRLRQVLGTRCQIQLKPVIDVNDQPAPVDSYEIPARIAEHLRLRQPADVFPYAAGGSRRTDLDHTIPYRSPDTWRPARSDRGREPRTASPPPPPTQNPRRLKRATTRGRQLDLARPHRTHLLGQQHRYSHARQRQLRPTDLARRQAPPTTDPSDPTEGTPLERIVRAHIEAFSLAT